MSTINHKLKTVTFTLAGIPFQCQLSSWKVTNSTPFSTRFYTYCSDGDFIEDGEPDYALDLKFFSDWTIGTGISDYLQTNDLQYVSFLIDHLASLAGQHVQVTGTCKIIAPEIGGDVRTTELTAVKLPCIGKPSYAHL